MKYFKIGIIGIILFISSMGHAQVSVNINIGSPPLWGPSGYSNVRYYYLPDVESYYDIETSMFIYYAGGTWLHKPHLPSIYSHYDLYDGYKVVMSDYHGNAPHKYFHDHKKKYAKGYKGKTQKTIGHKPGKGNSNSNGSQNNKAAQGGNKSQKQSGNSAKPSNSGKSGGSTRSSGSNKPSGSSKSGNTTKSQKGNSQGGGKKK